jgi:HEAT repeat protein
MAVFANQRFTWTFVALVGTAARLPLVLLPAVVLLAAGARSPDGSALILWVGAAFETAICLFVLCMRRSRRIALGPLIITLYLTGLSWLWFGDTVDDGLNHLAKACFIVVPIAFFGYLNLYESGALTLRRANLLAGRLANRQEWPSDLAACRALPEVKAFRAVLAYDAGPALVLLKHPRPEVRVAALAALEFRKEWRPGQAELVLQLAKNAEQPTVRAVAVAALANVEERELTEAVAQFLHDASREVRKAAMEALLWDCEKRWGWIRFAVRRILSDPLFMGDGPLVPEGQLLSLEAVKDLTGWCAEKGILSARASQTLAAHFNRALSERPEPAAVTSLKNQLASPHTPAILRLELGRVLQLHQELDPLLLEKLVDSSNPGSLRLIACETILSEHAENQVMASFAVCALRDLARLPNREIALATADIVQRRLGVDLGMGLGQPLPALNSRQAAEITRRVMSWAVQYDEEAEMAKSGMRHSDE